MDSLYLQHFPSFVYLISLIYNLIAQNLPEAAFCISQGPHRNHDRLLQKSELGEAKANTTTKTDHCLVEPAPTIAIV